MNEQLKNLFPTAISKGLLEIFGDQAIQPVLLRLISGGTVVEQTQDDQYFRRLLHPNEIDTLSGYKFPKRRSEYLTGRVCAKLAIEGFLSSSQIPLKPLLLSQIEIQKEPNGRPHVHIQAAQTTQRTNTDLLKIDISISHSGDYGVALAAESLCGIDLQRQEAALLRVQERYCSEAEFKLLEGSLPYEETVTRLAILWAAKEAAKKALSHLQMPGFLDLELCRLKNLKDHSALSFHVSQKKNRQMPKEVTVVTALFGEYALAICLLHEESSDAGTPRS